MLSLLEQPDDIVLSKNPVPVIIQARDDIDNMPFGAKGARSEMRSTGFVPFAEDDQIVISWTEPSGSETSITFTFKDVPAAEDEIPSDETAFIDYQAWYEAIAEKIMDHHRVGPFFSLYTDTNAGPGQSLWIEALDTDTGWVVSFDSSGVTTGTHNDFDYAEESTNLPANYYILLDIFVEKTYDEGNYERVAILKGIPDSESNVHFNLEEVLHKCIFPEVALDNGLPIPSFLDNEIVKADVIRRYYFRYTEYSDELADPVKNYSAIKLVLCGGIASNLFADFDFFAALDEDNSLLTWYPDGKNISTDQPEWLAWYNYTGSEKAIVLELIRETDTGSLATQYKYEMASPTAQDKEILLIPVGYDQLEISPDTVVKYTVRVIDADSDYNGGNADYLSQSRTFYVDLWYYKEKRYIQYLNGFCLPETLRCVGNFSNQLEVEREIFTRLLESGYTSDYREQLQLEEVMENIFTYRSGYLSRHEVDALQELLIYNMAWEVYEEGYIPLLIKSNQFPIYVTRQNLFSIEFEAVPSLRRGQYSNVQIAMDDDQTAWRTVADSFWKTVFGLTWKIAS